MGDKNLTIGTFTGDTKFDLSYIKTTIDKKTGVENKKVKILKKEILNKNKNRDMEDFMGLVEAKYEVPCVRKIQVNLRNGAKIPVGEKSNMTKEQILADRGSGNNYSLAIKYCKNETGRLYCVDFDSKQLENCNLFQELEASNTFRCETNKGYHFYVHMNDCPDYKCETKCGIGPVRDIDLICQKRNTWEPISREMTGEMIKSYNWEDLKHHFNHSRMNFTATILDDVPVVEIMEQIEIEADDTGSELEFDAANNPINTCSTEQLKSYLDRLGVNRYDYDSWVKVGLAISNNYQNNDEGLQMYIDWSMKDPDTDRRSSIVDISTKWQSFGYGSDGDPMTYKTIKMWANQDSPMNKYEMLYGDGGTDAVVAEMNKEIFYNRKTSEYIVMLPNRDWEAKSAADAAKEWEDKDFVIEIGDDQKIMNPFKIWKKSIKRKVIHKIVFDPKNNSPDCFNLWTGYPIGAKDCQDADTETIKPLLDHIYSKWCMKDPVQYNYVLDWFAHKLQKPWVKLAVVICLKSKEGSGKNIVLNKFKKIMRDYYVSISNVNQVLGDFNGMIEGKLLIDLDEVSYGGNKAQNNQLKALITEEEQIVNKKNKEMYKIDNFADYLITTNETYFLYVSTHSRRFNVLQMDDFLCGIQTEAKKAYIQEILDVPAEAFAKFLYNRDVSKFNPRQFTKTALFQKQVELNWSSEVKYLYKCLESGTVQTSTPRCDWNSTAYGYKGGFERKNKETGETKFWYKHDGLYGSYCASDLGAYATRVPINSFYETINDIFGAAIEERKYKNTKVVNLPNLNDARELFKKHQNFNYSFAEDLDELSDGEDGGYWSD
tara:strand:+ start:3337 stop:5817 length:2481 start_codon:yes stop_codon:yes gene_type:complete